VASTRGLDRAVARHHDDRRSERLRLLPLPQQADAVGIGHPDVEQHEVRRLAGAGGARLGCVRGHVHRVALLDRISCTSSRMSASSSTTRIRALLMHAPPGLRPARVALGGLALH